MQIKRATLLILAPVMLSIIAGAGYAGRLIPFSTQWPLYEALRTTASIIFAVIGAWMAIIYPERLKISFHNQSSQNEDGVKKLFTPIVHSTSILIVILIIGIAIPIIKTCTAIIPYTAFLRGASYAVLTILTLWQAWTIFLTFIPIDIIKSSVDNDRRRAETNGRLFNKITKMHKK